jgi:hypothetical protein
VVPLARCATLTLIVIGVILLGNGLEECLSISVILYTSELMHMTRVWRAYHCDSPEFVQDTLEAAVERIRRLGVLRLHPRTPASARHAHITTQEKATDPNVPHGR